MMADADGLVGVDSPLVVRERLEAFAEEVLAEAGESSGADGQRRVVSAGVGRAGRT